MLQIQQNFQGQWLEIENFRHVDHFRDITTLLPHIVKNAKSISTNKKYESYFKKFKHWCSVHTLDHLPASVSTVALFLGGLIQQRTSSSILEAYSIVLVGFIRCLVTQIRVKIIC